MKKILLATALILAGGTAVAAEHNAACLHTGDEKMPGVLYLIDEVVEESTGRRAAVLLDPHSSRVVAKGVWALVTSGVIVTYETGDQYRYPLTGAFPCDF